MFINRGTFRKTGGTSDAVIEPRFENYGTIEILSGRLRFNKLAHYEGELVISGTSLRGPIDLLGGTLSGNGTLDSALTNTGGIVSPGLSAGTLTIGSSFFQSGSGRLLMELGGVNAGQYDVVNLTSSNSFYTGGTLEVKLINGFVPARGDLFDILNFKLTFNHFDEVRLPVLPSPLDWDTSQLYTTGVIAVTPEPAAVGLLLAAAMWAGRRRPRSRQQGL